MRFSNRIFRFQEGGPMPEEQGAPMPEEGAPAPEGPLGPAPEGPQGPQGGPEEQLAQVAQQLIQMLMQQIGDPNAVGQILQMALEMLSQGAQGGAPEGGMPVQRQGGRLVRRMY